MEETVQEILTARNKWMLAQPESSEAKGGAKVGLSEYIGSCLTNDAVILLDVNNSVPQYIYDEDIAGKFDYRLTDTFMGFHCGKALFEVLKYFGIADITYNQPYATKNPWA